MPTVSTRLAYALLVNVVDLVVAIESDAQLRPAIQALKLCNRFGGIAPITILPTELIDLIKDDLTANILAATDQRRNELDKLYGCVTETCLDSPSLHMSAEQQLDRVNEAREMCKLPRRDSLAGWRSEDLESWIQELGSKYDKEDSLVHVRQVAEWYKLVGRPEDEHDGLFNKQQDVVRRYFGLEIFVAYSASSIDAGAGTDVYLTLPEEREGPNAIQDAHVLEDRCGRGSCNGCATRSTAESFARAIDMPRALSVSEAARFPKMLNELHVPGWELGNGDVEDEATRKRATPRLTLLVKVKDYGGGPL
ncbi:hypothetical protein LTS10_010276 [Elasticomyces elasticus]|nr:hypothetical protein LTS10_010276 [Elasticomyces elasticus]